MDKPYSIELVANKKAFELKEKGHTWEEIRTELNLAKDEVETIKFNYKSLKVREANERVK